MRRDDSAGQPQTGNTANDSVGQTESSESDPGGRAEPGARETRDQLPAVSVPKGGGAIRGVGEKFAANPVTGSGAMTVPLAVSSGRDGFGPELSLSYNSGTGNGPFGFGWSLDVADAKAETLS